MPAPTEKLIAILMAQVLLREVHTYLDRNGDGIACKSLRKG
jgi:hypothetical protein